MPGTNFGTVFSIFLKLAEFRTPCSIAGDGVKPGMAPLGFSDKGFLRFFNKTYISSGLYFRLF
jgi:hypothetical protein